MQLMVMLTVDIFIIIRIIAVVMINTIGYTIIAMLMMMVLTIDVSRTTIDISASAATILNTVITSAGITKLLSISLKCFCRLVIFAIEITEANRMLMVSWFERRKRSATFIFVAMAAMTIVICRAERATVP